MATTVLIIGESGTGKSTSIRNLNHEETYLINVVGKPLPFPRYKSKYITSSKEKEEKGNYYETDDHNKINKIIRNVDTERNDIKNLIIDDFQYVMSNEFMRRGLEKGYDKFTEIGMHAWEIFKQLAGCRSDLNCYILCHSTVDDQQKSKCKTIGKMLDDKICVEGLFTIVLHALIIDGKYVFLTQHDGSHIAKSPMGLFDDKIIGNDLSLVSNKLNDYYNDDIPQ